ncbi:hypothetical protein MNBD_UNCLBAC01-2045 [hydrothermal vent metagenome]|uniref:DUF3592 domain-containing protein n=1 Tax=hydrothermal vent metagenome TaxID=652676 RepID=A0A3B1DH81_9ZZZZ
MIENFGPLIIGMASLLGGLYLIIVSVQKIRLAKGNANNWPQTNGKVIKASKQRLNFGSIKSKNKKANSYVLDFEYEYIVDGQKFTSTKPLFFGLYLYGEIEQFLSRYPKGKNICVYYHPQHHDKAVIETTLYEKSGKHEISFGILLLTLAVIMFAIRFDVVLKWMQ